MSTNPTGAEPAELAPVDILADLDVLFEAAKSGEFGEYWTEHGFEHLIYPNVYGSAQIILRRYAGEEDANIDPTIRIESSDELAVELATGQRYRGKQLKFRADAAGPYHYQSLPEADPDTTDSAIDTRVGPVGQQQMRKLMAPKAVITGYSWAI